MEEVEGRCPSVHDLNYCCQNGYTTQLILKMESLLLNVLEWKLLLLTPRHFLELFLSKGATLLSPYEELIDNCPIPLCKIDAVQHYQRKYSEFFTDLCLQGVCCF